MDIRQISFVEYADRAHALATAHWLETESDLSQTPPLPDIGSYASAEKAGLLLTLGAFEGETMVGYSVTMLCTHPHYGFKAAFHDSLFLDAAHRKGRSGVRLILATEQLAIDHGAKGITWNAKLGSAFHDLIARLGARAIETVFWKDL